MNPTQTGANAGHLERPAKNVLAEEAFTRTYISNDNDTSLQYAFADVFFFAYEHLHVRDWDKQSVSSWILVCNLVHLLLLASDAWQLLLT